MSTANIHISRLRPHRISRNLNLWCEPNHLSFLSHPTIIDAINNSEAHITQPDIHLLKTGTRRRVVHIERDETPLVLKSFPFTKIKEKLKYKKYGLAEITNNIKACQLDIPTPLYYAYFERRALGLVNLCGCITNFLVNQKPLEEIIQQDINSLDLAIPALKELFLKGVNHIDVSPANIFIDADNQFNIIDWQYCSFLNTNDPLQLAVHAAHFLRNTNIELSQHEIYDWIEKLYMSATPKVTKDQFISAVITLQNQKLPIKDRLSLNFDRNILFCQ